MGKGREGRKGGKGKGRVRRDYVLRSMDQGPWYSAMNCDSGALIFILTITKSKVI